MLFARVCKLRDVAVLEGSRSLAVAAAANLAELLAHLAVIKKRRLFAAAGCPSIHDFCVRELGLSEDAMADGSRLRDWRPITPRFSTRSPINGSH